MAYSRRIFLINKKFQFRFAFYVCTWLVALSFVYPLIIYNIFDYFMRYLALDPLGPGLANLERTREELLSLLGIMQVILLSLAFVISIFMSHKIAGPLYKLSRFFHEAAEGNIKQTLSFRKKDYFQELTGEYNHMMEAIRARIAIKNEGIGKAIPKLEKVLNGLAPEAKLEIEAALKVLKATQDT